MSAFVKRAHRINFETRLRHIVSMLNNQKEVSVEQIMKTFKVSSSWAERLLKDAEIVLDGVVYDPINKTLKKVEE